MAEDAPAIEDAIKTEQDEYKTEEDEFQGGEYVAGGRHYARPQKPRCNIRIEELARPKKWLLLGTWREFHAIFDPERMQKLKEKVQEEFSMSPEETELYFSQLRKHVRKMRSKKALEKQLKREKAIAKQEAYTLFKKRLRRALRYAFEHQPPAIVSPMLRDLSDNILEKLADLHHVDVPNRDSTDKNSVFLVCIADWAAKLVSNIYYEVDACDRADVGGFKQEASSKVSICHSSVSEEEEEEIEEEDELGAEEEEDQEEEGPRQQKPVSGATPEKEVTKPTGAPEEEGGEEEGPALEPKPVEAE